MYLRFDPLDMIKIGDWLYHLATSLHALSELVVDLELLLVVEMLDIKRVWLALLLWLTGHGGLPRLGLGAIPHGRRFQMETNKMNNTLTLVFLVSDKFHSFNEALRQGGVDDSSQVTDGFELDFTDQRYLMIRWRNSSSGSGPRPDTGSLNVLDLRQVCLSEALQYVRRSICTCISKGVDNKNRTGSQRG